MLKREITYENPFTEQRVTETHYFHISKADLVRMQLEEHGNTYVKDGEELEGFQAKLARIMDAQDGKAIMDELEDIIRRSFGRKDGDRFIKSDEIWQEFKSTEAFSQLFFELCTKPDVASHFINGVIPNNLDEIAAEVASEAEKIKHAEALGTKAPASGISEGTAQVAGALADEANDPSGLTTSTPAANTDGATARSKAIENASPENPVMLTQAEVAAMDSDELKSGVATGKYRLN